jgi:hypothetical protein
MAPRALDASSVLSEPLTLALTGRAARDRDALFGASAGTAPNPAPVSRRKQPVAGAEKRPRPGRPLNGAADAAVRGLEVAGEAAPPSTFAASTSAPDAELLQSRQTQVEQLRRQATDAALRGRQSSRRALQLAREARAIGVDVTMRLGEQDEQLDRVQNDLDEIHGHLTHSDEIIHDMQSFWKKMWPWARDRNRRHERYAPVLGADGPSTSATRHEIACLQRQREAGTLNLRERPPAACSSERSADEARAADDAQVGSSPGSVPAHALLQDAVDGEAASLDGDSERRRGLLSSLRRVTRRVRGVDEPEDRVRRERAALLAEGTAPTAAADAAAASPADATECADASAQASAAPWEEHVQAQDRDLDELSVVVSDLRTLAVGIGEQVRHQSAKIDVISKDVDYGRERIHENNRRIRRML